MSMTRTRTLALIVTLSISGSGVPVIAAGAGQTPSLGAISGTATSSAHQALGHIVVRLRSIQTGKVTAVTSSDAAGHFSFVGLNPDTYVIELVSATGQIVGTSGAIFVSSGAVVTGALVASSVAAGAAATSTILLTTLGIVTAAAASAAIAGVAVPATTTEASGSN